MRGLAVEVDGMDMNGKTIREMSDDILGGCLCTMKDDRTCVVLGVCYFSAAMISPSCDAAR